MNPEHIKDQAFPMPGSASNTPRLGLTKREYFAALAMQGMLAHNGTRDMPDM